MVPIVYKATLVLVPEKLEKNMLRIVIIVIVTVRYLLDWIVSLLLFPRRVTGNMRIPLDCCQLIPSFRLRDNSVYFHECSPFWVDISTICI